jgi:hypothetical protein
MTSNGGQNILTSVCLFLEKNSFQVNEEKKVDNQFCFKMDLVDPLFILFEFKPKYVVFKIEKNNNEIMFLYCYELKQAKDFINATQDIVKALHYFYLLNSPLPLT